jgi:very-short-patch-repair endonuclease
MRSSLLTAKRAKALRRKLTEPELMLWSRLKRRSPEWPVFRCQHPFGPYILDLFCPAARLALEVDGAVHGGDAQMAHDDRRDAWLASQGVAVVRVPASAVFADANAVADGARRRAADLIEKRGAYPTRAAAPSTTRSSAGGPPPPSSSRRGRQG